MQLTKEQQKEFEMFLDMLKAVTRKNMEKALKSGALSEEDINEHFHKVIKAVMDISATCNSPKSKEIKANLEHFI